MYEVVMRYMWSTYEVHMKYIWDTYEVDIRHIWSTYVVCMKYVETMCWTCQDKVKFAKQVSLGFIEHKMKPLETIEIGIPSKLLKHFFFVTWILSLVPQSTTHIKLARLGSYFGLLFILNKLTEMKCLSCHSLIVGFIEWVTF